MEGDAMGEGCLELGFNVSSDRAVVALRAPDPLAEDRTDDADVRLTDRQLARVVFVAAETGSRFTREGLEADPAAWMFAPRRVFDGERPIEACVTRHGFVAAMLLHGVWHDVDAHPAVIEDLLDGEDVELPCAPRSLYSAFVSSPCHGGPRQAFYATVAADGHEARSRLMLRVGRLAADAADLQPGFDGDDPRARLLLPGILLEFLSRIRVSATPRGFEVFVDYRGIE